MEEETTKEDPAMKSGIFDFVHQDLAGFVEEISVRISANEDALRAVANGGSAE